MVIVLNAERIAACNNVDHSFLPVYEPGLAAVGLVDRRLHFRGEVQIAAPTAADMVFLSVNTPTKKKLTGCRPVE